MHKYNSKCIEAMEDGGSLTVGTKHLTNERKIAIYIKDTGTGMDSKTIVKLGNSFLYNKGNRNGFRV
ncbi:hypothetical protein KHA80_10970 [Anaerobacillus sp. HL2]|nr:hypothetical protein KHA80_10970 [Anaerobacillus sp. HL2]